MAADPITIANCSGFFGDRRSAAREMVEGGPIDVLTGDWLAELTLLILARQRAKDPTRGFATTFLAQLEEVLGTCLDQGIKVVSNAGGVNPRGCVEAIGALAARLGLHPRVAFVEGDDLLGDLDDLIARGILLDNLDTGESLAHAGVRPVTANAYLGGFGIATALERGADIVVTGRVTDAAVIVGPAAWWHGWDRTDWDRLAGAIVAGHIIECGTQCTGGNYAFFREVPGLERCGFPLAEIHEDGSSVITKHPGTGGLVSTGTVTAQLLYEIQSIRYLNPDAVVRLDTVQVTQEAPDRVRVSGVRGLPAPTTAKVAINYDGGFRNTMTLGVTGLDIEDKAALALRTLWSSVPGGRASFDEVETRLVRTDRADPSSNEEAVAHLRVTVTDADRDKVGRAFSNLVIEMLLASYPGFFATTPPTDATAFGVYWPALVPAEVPRHTAVFEGEQIVIPSIASTGADSAPVGDRVGEVDGAAEPGSAPSPAAPGTRPGVDPSRPTTRVPLGTVFGARSGDKGGNANLGVWARDEAAHAWLVSFLTVDRLRELLPETASLAVTRYELPNLRALNFVIVGLLGRGVAASTRVDPQAKGLGEYLRAKLVDLPTELLPLA